MNEKYEITCFDLHGIEMEARRLRSQATRELFSAISRRIASLFALRGLSAAKAA